MQAEAQELRGTLELLEGQLDGAKGWRWRPVWERLADTVIAAERGASARSSSGLSSATSSSSGDSSRGSSSSRSSSNSVPGFGDIRISKSDEGS